ncbi:MAG: dihydroneopterin aldolase [Actinomycetota bacterium]|jgi:dihydroneopterin aldolase|nr:dihydroneopterin aldolase [Actinomycetota bacterium]
MTGRIEIRDLRVLGVHGVLPHERMRAQPFSVDVDASFDVAAAAESDALGDTVDYGAVASSAAGVVSHRSFALLEALAAAIARQVLDEHPRVTRAEVVVRKVRPPVDVDVGSVGVRVVDERRP